MSARSRRSRTVSVGIASISLCHSFPSSTGVLPVFTTCFGPRTAAQAPHTDVRHQYRACACVEGAKGFVQRTREAQAGRIMRRADRTAADLITVAADDIDEAAAIAAAA